MAEGYKILDLKSWTRVKRKRREKKSKKKNRKKKKKKKKNENNKRRNDGSAPQSHKATLIFQQNWACLTGSWELKLGT
jgi:hypothetical protein